MYKDIPRRKLGGLAIWGYDIRPPFLRVRCRWQQRWSSLPWTRTRCTYRRLTGQNTELTVSVSPFSESIVHAAVTDFDHDVTDQRSHCIEPHWAEWLQEDTMVTNKVHSTGRSVGLEKTRQSYASLTPSSAVSLASSSPLSMRNAPTTCWQHLNIAKDLEEKTQLTRYEHLAKCSMETSTRSTRSWRTAHQWCSPSRPELHISDVLSNAHLLKAFLILD